MPFEVGYTAELYDYSGLPYNDAGRARADACDISDWSISGVRWPPHPGPYNWYYGGGFRITKDIDRITREARRLPRPVPAQRRSPDLHGWKAASAGVGPAHLVRLLHGQGPTATPWS